VDTFSNSAGLKQDGADRTITFIPHGNDGLSLGIEGHYGNG
jgi:hypothetical protein